MFDIDGFVADEINDYIYDDGGKFQGFVKTVWEDLIERHGYQKVVNTLNYFATNFHSEDEAREYRRELGIKKNSFTCEAVSDIFKTAALLYGIILADRSPDYLKAGD